MTSIRLNTNDYNVGALSGKYALKNLANTGKFSNIVEELPVKTSFEISTETEGLITLKEGSFLTIPYGISEVDGKTPIIHHERISADKSINVGHAINDRSQTSLTDAKTYLIYNYDADELECDSTIDYRFIDEDEYEGDVLRLQKNTFVRYDFKNRCALPLGYFDDVWCWHPFTALGFFKSRMWVDSGLLFYAPRGRKENYGLQVDAVSIEDVVYTDIDELISGTMIDSSDASGLILLDLYGKARMTDAYQSSVEPTTYDGYEYVSSDNYIYDSNKLIVRLCKVCDVVLKNNKFHELKNFNTYKTVDFAEVSGKLRELDEIMLHNDGRAEVVKGAHSFPYAETFANIIVNGGTLNEINVAGKINLPTINSSVDANIPVGTINMDDAYIKSVNAKATNPNCIAIIGKGNSARGGLVFGKGNTVKILADETANTITVNMPSGGQILPQLDNNYNLGSSGKRFKNVYAETFQGKATSSNWADLAEIYATDEKYPVGTLLQFGGQKELTIAHNEVNAVVSEKPGVLMNSEGEGQPVALAGRVRVRVEGPVKKFQKIYLSNKDGIGTTVGCLGEIPIARALENKDTEEEGLVLCAVHFNI